MLNQLQFPYVRQSISEEDIQEVGHALRQPLITRGALVEQFEKAIAAYCRAEYAVVFNSGSTALMAAYFAAGLGQGDRLISTPNTFIATIGAAVQLGATPVFLDIDRQTGNMDLQHLADNVNLPSVKRKTVIAPVHYSGIPVDMQQVQRTVANLRTLVVEDACQAFGSHYRDGSRVGSCQWSDMTVFSFHPAKTITTGEGGAVTTNDPDLLHKLQLFRNNGIERDPSFLQKKPGPWYYEVVSLTGNYNFTEIQAALGLSQLKRAEAFIQKKRTLLACYEKLLKKVEHVRLLTPEKALVVAPHLCVVQIDFAAYKVTRERVMEQLKERGIGTQVHYIPIYRHPYFANQQPSLVDYFPQTEAFYAQALSLPLYYDLSEEQVKQIVNALQSVLPQS